MLTANDTRQNITGADGRGVPKFRKKSNGNKNVNSRNLTNTKKSVESVKGKSAVSTKKNTTKGDEHTMQETKQESNKLSTKVESDVTHLMASKTLSAILSEESSGPLSCLQNVGTQLNNLIISETELLKESTILDDDGNPLKRISVDEIEKISKLTNMFNDNMRLQIEAYRLKKEIIKDLVVKR